MGNYCSCLKNEYSEIEESKCTRCGRPGHNLSVCYASRHPDGSSIRQYCQSCGQWGHSSYNCRHSGCIVS